MFAHVVECGGFTETCEDFVIRDCSLDGSFWKKFIIPVPSGGA
jgi:hypothetical protein